MQVPSWLESYLDSSRLEHIRECVKEVEKTTAGEIVPMIVKRSATIGHVSLTLSLLLMLFYILLVDFLDYFFHFSEDKYLWMGLGIIVMFGFGLGLARFFWIQRLLISKLDLLYQVNMRAELEFFEAGLDKTVDATGILLFVSIMEHRAVVLADKGIADKLPPETWDEVMNRLILGIKKRDMSAGFCDAIQRCGAILSEHFPIKADDQNELPNRLVVKE